MRYLYLVCNIVDLIYYMLHYNMFHMLQYHLHHVNLRMYEYFYDVTKFVLYLEMEIIQLQTLLFILVIVQTQLMASLV